MQIVPLTVSSTWSSTRGQDQPANHPQSLPLASPSQSARLGWAGWTPPVQEFALGL